MKFTIASILLHSLIFISALSFASKELEITSAGSEENSTTMSVNFTLPSTPKVEEEVVEEIIEEKIVEEKVMEEVKEEIKEEVIEVKEEPKLEPKIIKEKIKKPIPEKPKKPVKKKVSQKKKVVEKKKVSSSNNSNLVQLSQGVFAVKNQGVKGLEYKILNQPDPEYPAVAKRLGYNKPVAVRVRFLVGYNGKIEDIKFYNEKDKLGFNDSVKNILKHWRFSPVTLNKEPIKLYFYKEFKFNRK